MKIIEVIENINRGGFGVIDKVLCDDGNHYARKTFSPTDDILANKALYDKIKDRFVREVKTQKVLPDDYFIPVLFDDLNSPSPYFIMPLADEVYTEEIDNSKTESRHPNGLGDILNGLEFLHDKGLVHRDLKPQNILKHNGVWKLADFGLITQDKEILSKTITTSNNAYGTVMYCAPEQVIEFNRITPSADIYSFGAILHDIFTDGTRVPYSELSANGEIGYIIEKCTRHNKELRFRSIKALRSKLLSLLSKNDTKAIGGEDKEWKNKFKELSKWDEDTFENFVFYLKKNSDFSNIIFYEITEETLSDLKAINKYHFNDLALIYLDWIYNSSFGWDYCDVIVNNIHWIYQKTKDVEVKSKCVISAAELGKSHNRWYVMKYVVSMGDHSIDDSLAFRIGMDISLETRNKINFQMCASQIHYSIERYHPLIKENLD